MFGLKQKIGGLWATNIEPADIGFLGSYSSDQRFAMAFETKEAAAGYVADRGLQHYFLVEELPGRKPIPSNQD